MAKQVDYESIGRSARARGAAGKAVIYVLLTLWALMVLFPFYWMVLTSFKSYSSYNSEYVPKFYATNPTTQNYRDAFTAVPLAKYFGNTLIFTVVTTAVMLVVVVLAAFAFARLNFKGKDLLLFTSSWCVNWALQKNEGLELRDFSKN